MRRRCFGVVVAVEALSQPRNAARSLTLQPCRDCLFPHLHTRTAFFVKRRGIQVLCKEETKCHELETRTTIPLPRGTIVLQTSISRQT